MLTTTLDATAIRPVKSRTYTPKAADERDQLLVEEVLSGHSWQRFTAPSRAETIEQESDQEQSQTSSDHATRVVKPVLSVGTIEKSRLAEKFHAEQEFEGVVTRVEKGVFWARLIDLSGGHPDEEAEFEFSEVYPEDWKFIQCGALFSWVMGLATRRGNTKRESEIRFRRVFSWSSDDVRAAQAAADEEAEVFGWK